MSVHIDKIQKLRIMRTPCFMPIIKKNKRYGSALFLLTPDFESVCNFVNPNKIKSLYHMDNLGDMFSSIYEEKDVNFIISDKGLLNEQGELIDESNGLFLEYLNSPFIIEEDGCLLYENKLHVLNEDAVSNKLKRILYNNRIKNSKEVLEKYKFLKSNYNDKLFFASDIKQYKGRNIFVMNRYINQAFNVFGETTQQNLKNIRVAFKLLTRFFNNKNLNSYTKKTVVIPVEDWKRYANIDDENANIALNPKLSKLTPLNMIVHLFRNEPGKLSDWSGIEFIFTGATGYFKYDFSDINKVDTLKFINCLNNLIKNSVVGDIQAEDAEDKATTIISKLEKDSKLQLNCIDGSTEGKSNAEVISKIVNHKISDKAKMSSNITEEDIVEDIESNAEIKARLLNIKKAGNLEDNKDKISIERQRRFNELDNKFINKQIEKKTIKELLDTSSVKLEKTTLDESKVESIDDTWHDLKKPNFEKDYNVKADIIQSINSLSDKDKDIAMHVVNIEIEDTSTTEDSIETYRVTFEDSLNKRHTLVFDVPKIENNRFLKLRGNAKVLNGQLVNLPIIKTEEDTVQVVSNYNKIFIRLNKPLGKVTQVAQAIIKTLNTIKETNYIDPETKKKSNINKIITGNNMKICKKYTLPLEYIELCSFFTKVETNNDGRKIEFYFNQDEIKEKYNIPNNEFCFAVVNGKPQIDEYFNNMMVSFLTELNMDPYFNRLYDSFFSTQKSAAYSEASILSSKIPLIVIMAYSVGLTKALDIASVKYSFTEKRPKRSEYYIKFKDAYLVYNGTVENVFLLNGLYKINTEDYTVAEIDSKQMWVDALDLFGARYKADGLDSFYNLMMDPITVKVCQHYNLPYEYIEVLAYANSLLVTNEYNRHVDMSGNRFRTNERIAHFVYKALATSYGNYLREVKSNRKDAKMSIKRTAVIDLAMEDATMSDLSMLTPLLELESANTISYKGLAGMNSDRSYQLDKRTFDKSMVNKIAMSTGFSGNVGINRQATINMEIDDTKGYINVRDDKTELDNMNDANTLSITEALTPLGTTHDDPFRTAMTFIQTAKHGTRTAKSDPLLVSSGADQALPYLTSDMFAFKAKEDGKVIKITDDFIKVKYKSGKEDIVDLRSHIEKNSDGGFYISIKLDTDLKVGQSFKKDSIIAFDKSSYSNDFGVGNLSYNIGKLAKIAIMCTDEGFEDSATASESLAQQMSSMIIVKVDVMLDKTDVINSYSKVGTNVIEGEPVFSYMHSVSDPEVDKMLDKLIVDKAAVQGLGNINILSKVTGVLEDIKVYSTVKTSEMHKSLASFCKYIYDREDKYLKSVNKPIPERVLPPVGKLKNSEDKVLIEFYFKYKDDLSVGDKIVYFSALKGTIKRIYPKGEEPRSEFRKNEIVSSLLPLSGVNARMVGSVPILLSLNKILIELDRYVKDIYGIKHNDGLED